MVDRSVTHHCLSSLPSGRRKEPVSIPVSCSSHNLGDPVVSLPRHGAVAKGDDLEVDSTALDLDDVLRGKFDLDTTGHYARNDGM